MRTRCGFMRPSCSALPTGIGVAWVAIPKVSNCSSTAPRYGYLSHSGCARRECCATCSSRWPRRRGARHDRAAQLALQKREGAMRRASIVLILGLAASSALAQSKEPILLREMGSFHIGGRIIEGNRQPIKEVMFTPPCVPAKMEPHDEYTVEPKYVQYMKQGVPRWLTTDDQIVAAYIELVDKICPCVVLVHSQSGSFGYKVLEARPDKVKALVAVEPTLGGDRNKVQSIKTTPILVLYGDNAKDHPRWSKIRQAASTTPRFSKPRAAASMSSTCRMRASMAIRTWS